MNISKFKLVAKCIFGFLNPTGSAIGSMVSYILECVRIAANDAMSAIDDEKKASIKRWFDVTTTALNILYKLQPYVPTKWQLEYRETIEAINVCHNAIEDFEITEDELKSIYKEVDEAVKAWEAD